MTSPDLTSRLAAMMVKTAPHDTKRRIDWDAILPDAVARGMIPAVVMRTYHIHATTLRHALTRHGVVLSGRWQRTDWTLLDAKLTEMRKQGLSWAKISDALGFSNKTTVLRRGDVLRIKKPKPAPVAAPLQPIREDHNPMRAGHPVSWGAINAGLQCLDGVPFNV